MIAVPRPTTPTPTPTASTSASASSLVFLVRHVGKRERLRRALLRVARPVPGHVRDLPVVASAREIHQRHHPHASHLAHQTVRPLQVFIARHRQHRSQRIRRIVECTPDPTRARFVRHVHLEHVRSDGEIDGPPRGALEAVPVPHVPLVESQSQTFRCLSPALLQVQADEVEVVGGVVTLEEPADGEELKAGAAAERRPTQRDGPRGVARFGQTGEDAGLARALEAGPRLGEALHALVADVLLLQAEVAVLRLGPGDVVLAHVGLSGVDALTLRDDGVGVGGGWVRRTRGVDLGLYRTHHGRRRAEQTRQKSVPVRVAVERPSLVAVLKVLATGPPVARGTQNAVERGVEVRKVQLRVLSRHVGVVRTRGRVGARARVAAPNQSQTRFLAQR